MVSAIPARLAAMRAGNKPRTAAMSQSPGCGPVTGSLAIAILGISLWRALAFSRNGANTVQVFSSVRSGRVPPATDVAGSTALVRIDLIAMCHEIKSNV